MHIQINPRSLLNLENMVEVLYKLHPSVLNFLVDMEESLGDILGFIDLKNLSLPERKFLAGIADLKNVEKEEIKKIHDDTYDPEGERFHKLRKYIQLDTDEYIPMEIYVKVEDPVIGKKVKNLVKALEKTRAPEQFYLHKKEVDEDAYFAEGYGLTMNEEQKKQRDNFFWGEDVKGLEELLRKEKLYP